MACATSKKLISTLVSESVSAFNLTGLVPNGQWTELISDYFCDETVKSDDSDESDDDEKSNDSRDNSVELDDTEKMNCEYEVNDMPLTCTNEVAVVISSNDLNLVSDDEIIEKEKIAKFMCKCKHNNGLHCCILFDHEYTRNYRLEMFELSTREKDLVILGELAAHIQRSDETQSSHRKTQKTRQLTRVTYYHDGKQICRDMFKFLHSVSQDKLTSLISRYKEHGFANRKCKSGGRVASHALSLEYVTRVISFITNYAESHAIILPGRIPGYKRSDMKLLPSCVTKAPLWRMYDKIMTDEGVRAVKLSSFRRLWGELLPYIVVMKPMTDLCWRCQSNNTKIIKSANTSESEKSGILKEQEEHLRIVQLERSLYQEQVSSSKQVVIENKLDLAPTAPCTRDIVAHYSFDFAQQIFYPNNPLQPGPIYFLVPRKCAIFGISCEAVLKQINYLIDEASSVSKGSNSVISYLDHFLSHYGLGETQVHLHADNCCGQNKNRFMLQYLIWRTLTRQHQHIQLHFLITGHTKFAPDWCFGLLKQKYCRMPVSCLRDIADAVSASTVNGANVPQLVGHEDGTQIVETRDWQVFFDGYFKPFPNIKSYQHFRFDAAHPGVVFFKKYADSEEASIQLLCNISHCPGAQRPEPVSMPGLDLVRQQYLYDKIRPFVREDVADIVCPAPHSSGRRNKRRRGDDDD